MNVAFLAVVLIQFVIIQSVLLRLYIAIILVTFQKELLILINL
jgi:hypothetical protein